MSIQENSDAGIVILGGGQAGGRAAKTLRDSGWTGSIDLVCAELHAPYERPILSKQYLRGDVAHDSFLVVGPDWLKGDDITLHLGTRATRIDPDRRVVDLSGGRELPYQKLLIATGRAPRIFDVPGIAPGDVRYLRTIEDAQRLRGTLSSGKRIAIVGAGYIAMEVAATAIGMGCRVDVVQRGAGILARDTSSSVSAFVLARHIKEGVRFHFAASISAAEHSQARLILRLSNGTTLTVDVLLAGIGATPDCQLGNQSDDGVTVDEFLRTDLPDVYAAGDVARLHDSRTGQIRECQNWECAELQGALAARNMLGADETYDAMDWMWSDQFDLSIQTLGDTSKNWHEVDRQLDTGVMSFFLDEQNQLVGVSAVGDKRIGRAISLCRRMIERASPISVEELMNSQVDLKTILKSMT